MACPQLVESIRAKLTGNVRLNAKVVDIRDGYKITLEDGTVLNADSLILATPAHVSSVLLESVAGHATQGLQSIRYAGIGSMSLLFDKADVPNPLDAYGVVIPASAGRMIDGMQWANSKWINRAPDDKALIRVFYGGPNTRTMLEKSGSELLAIIREELRAIIGITSKPQWLLHGRWESAYPQYDVGHIERIAAIENALPENIALAGKCLSRGWHPRHDKNSKNGSTKNRKWCVMAQAQYTPPCIKKELLCQKQQTPKKYLRKQRPYYPAESIALYEPSKVSEELPV